MSLQCQFNAQWCYIKHDFEPTVTNVGFCMTFNPGFILIVRYIPNIKFCSRQYDVQFYFSFQLYHDTHHDMRIPERDVTDIVLSVYYLRLLVRIGIKWIIPKLT